MLSHETSRLRLTALNKDSADLVLRFYDENRDTFEPWEPKRSPNFYTLSYQRAILTAEHNLICDGKLIRYWIFLKDYPHEIIGSISFQNLLPEPYQSCTLGYKIAKKHQGKGYAYEALVKSIETLQDHHNIHRIEAYIMSNNKASIGLIQKLHFIYEGPSYGYAKVNGHWANHLRFSYILPEI